MERIRFILDRPEFEAGGETLRHTRFDSDTADAEICSLGPEQLDEWIFKGRGFGMFANSESRESYSRRKENSRRDIAKLNRLTQLDE